MVKVSNEIMHRADMPPAFSEASVAPLRTKEIIWTL